MSTDSGMFENPFREGGKLSRDAEVIIDALKTGKLSVISNQVGWVLVIVGTVIMVQVLMIVAPRAARRWTAARTRTPRSYLAAATTSTEALACLLSPERGRRERWRRR